MTDVMQWTVSPNNPEYRDVSALSTAADIVRWVNANNGEAYYEPGGEFIQSNGMGTHLEPRIRLRTANGIAYAWVGDYIVRSNKWFYCDKIDQADDTGPYLSTRRVREFYPTKQPPVPTLPNDVTQYLCAIAPLDPSGVGIALLKKYLPHVFEDVVQAGTAPVPEPLDTRSRARVAVDKEHEAGNHKHCYHDQSALENDDL